MSVSESYDDRLMADLAAAADGTLAPARQAELEAMAAADSELAAALDGQRRAMTLIRAAAADVHAPLALRERLEADRARLARPRARRRRLSVAFAGATAAAVLLAVVLAAPGGPTVEEAAAFASQPPTAPAAEGKLLAAEQDGVEISPSSSRCSTASADVVVVLQPPRLGQHARVGLLDEVVGGRA